MQAPFAFDSDGNLVISARMVEALGLAKDQSTKQWGLFVKDGRVRADLLSVESLTFGKLRESRDMAQTDPSEVIRAISGEIKQADLHPSLSEAIDAITTEQQARADADSALASRASALEANIGDVEVSLTDEQQARATGDEALANDIATLESRLESEGANWRSEIEALRGEIQGKIMRLEHRIDSMN